MPRVAAVRWADGLRGACGDLADDLVDAVDAALAGRRGVDLPCGEHVELLVVDGRAVRVNAFLDVDGTLWVEALAAGGA